MMLPSQKRRRDQDKRRQAENRKRPAEVLSIRPAPELEDPERDDWSDDMVAKLVKASPISDAFTKRALAETYAGLHEAYTMIRRQIRSGKAGGKVIGNYKGIASEMRRYLEELGTLVREDEEIEDFTQG